MAVACRGWLAGVAVVAFGVSAAVADPPRVVPPEVRRLAAPSMDLPAVARDVEVGLELVIDESGRVAEAVVMAPAGAPFDEAARQALLASDFRPALVDGVPRAVKVAFTYVFAAATDRAPAAWERLGRRARESAAGQALAGVLLEKGTRAPVEGALVLLSSARGEVARQAVTDADGRFAAEGLEAGEWRVEVVEGDHGGATQLVRLAPALAAPPGSPADAGVSVVELEPIYVARQGRGRFETVVREERQVTAATVVTLRDEELRRTPGTFGDPTRVVATLPGVARSPFGLGYYVVRGASFENTGFFIDDHPALFLYHLLGGPAVIHPQLVGAVQFYPGGYPVQYGRFAGGVIALHTADPPRDRWHLDVEVDVLKASAFFSVPFDDGRGVVSVAARRSYFELFVPLIVDGVELSYTDYQLRASWAPRDGVRLRFLALGAEDRFESSDVDNEADTGSSQHVALGFHRLTAAVEWDVVRDLTLWSSTAWEFDYTRGGRTSADDDALSVDVSGWFLNPRVGLRVGGGSTVQLDMGFDALVATVTADLDLPALPPLGDPRPPEFDPIAVPVRFNGPYTGLSPWVSARIEPWPGFALLPAVRFNVDRYASQWRLTLDPKVTLRWAVHPAWTLKGTVGLVHQPPQSFQVEAPYGDASIPHVQALQTSAGVEWRPDERFECTVEGFYNTLDNLSRPQDIITSEDGQLQRTTWAADVDGRSYGLEVLLRRQLGDWWYGWVSYTLIRAERRFPPAGWALAAFDQTHILNAALAFELGDGWTLGTRFTLTSGTPYYPVQGARYDADRDQYEPLFASRQGRLPPFHRLDLRVDKEWAFDTWIFGFFVDVQNVYNARNPETQRYSYDFRIRTDGPGVPILPTLGVKARF